MDGGRRSVEQAVLQRILQAQQQKDAEGRHFKLEDLYSDIDTSDEEDCESLSYGVPKTSKPKNNPILTSNKPVTGAGCGSTEQAVLQRIRLAQQQKYAVGHLNLEDLYSVADSSADDEEEEEEEEAEIAKVAATTTKTGGKHSNTLAAASGAAETLGNRETRRSFEASLNAKVAAAQSLQLGGSTLDDDEAPAQQKYPSSHNRSHSYATDLGEISHPKRKVILIKKKQAANSTMVKEKPGSSTGRKSPGSVSGVIRRTSDGIERSGCGEDNDAPDVPRRKSRSKKRSSADSSCHDNNNLLLLAAAAAAEAMEPSRPRRKSWSDKRERGSSLGRTKKRNSLRRSKSSISAEFLQKQKPTSHLQRQKESINRDHSVLTSEERLSEALGRSVPVRRSRSSIRSEQKAESQPRSISPAKSTSAKSCGSGKSSGSHGHCDHQYSSSNDHNHRRYRSSRDSRSVEEESNRRHRRRKSGSDKSRGRDKTSSRSPSRRKGPSRSTSRGRVPPHSPGARSTGKAVALDQRHTIHTPRRRKSGSEKQLRPLTSQTEYDNRRSSRRHSGNEQAPVVHRKSGSQAGEQENGGSHHRSRHKHEEGHLNCSKSIPAGQHGRPSSNKDHGAPLPSEDKEERHHHSSNSHHHHKSSSDQTGILRKPSIGRRPSDDMDAPGAPHPPNPKKQPGILRKASVGSARTSSIGSGSDQQTSRPPEQTSSQPEAKQDDALSHPRSLLKKSSFDQQTATSSLDIAGTFNSNGRPVLLRRSTSQDSDDPDDGTLSFEQQQEQQQQQQQQKPVFTKRLQDIRKAWESGQVLNEVHDKSSAFDEDKNKNADVFPSTNSKVVKAMEKIHGKDAYRCRNKKLEENTNPIGEIMDREEWEEEKSICTFQDEEDDMEEPFERPRFNDNNGDDDGEQSNLNDDEEEEECADDEILEDESTHHSDEGDLLKSSKKKVDSVKKPRKTFEDDEEDEVGGSSFGDDFSQYSSQDLEERDVQEDDNPLMEFPFEITANGPDIPPAEEIESEDAIIMTPLGLESPVVDVKKGTCKVGDFAAFDNNFGDGDDNDEEMSDIESASEDPSMSGEEEVAKDEEDDEDSSSQHQESARQHTYGRKVQEIHDAGGLKVTDYGDYSESESFRRDQKMKPKAKPQTRSPKPGLLHATLKAVVPADECASDDESACLSSFAESTRRKGEAFDFEPLHRRGLDNSDSEESDRGPIKVKRHSVGRYLARVVKQVRREEAYESDATSVSSARSKSKRGLLGRSSKRHAHKLND